MSTLSPKPGFDWTRLTWGRPDSPPSALCSYCSAPLSGNEVTLVLWDDKARRADFCDACQNTWWRFKSSDDPNRWTVL
ncbi:MAG: hypothetical protein WAN43_16260 [Rhodomicrobium sp.]